MTDIVERLRARSEAAQTTRLNLVKTPRVTLQEAADTIAALRTALAAAEERAKRVEELYEISVRSQTNFRLFNEELERSLEAAEALVARFVEACGPFVRLEWPDFGVKDSDIAVVRTGALRLGDFRALASLTAEAKGE